MKVSYKRLVHPDDAVYSLNVTRGKPVDFGKTTRMSLRRWKKLLLSQHSPLRHTRWLFYIEGIEYYAHIHLRTHGVGVQIPDNINVVESQRGDKNRGERRQDELVNMLIDCNATSLINMAEARLCQKADSIAQKALGLIKRALEEGDEFDVALANMLVPACESNGWCKEWEPCGYVKSKMFKPLHSILPEEEQKKRLP